MEIILKNIEINEGSFLYELREGRFDLGLYNQFVKSVYDNNKSEMDDQTRCKIAFYLWEISLRVYGILSSDLDERDILKIENITDDIRFHLHEKFYIMANFFTYKKEMYLDGLLL